MLDQSLVNELAKKHELRISGIFKKYNLISKKLDTDHSTRKPDYFVTSKDEESFICECKYIASAGMTSDRKYHISTLESDLHQYGVFQPDTLSKLKDVLYDAQSQYLDLISADSKYKIYPFVVAVESDFFAEGFDFLPKNVFGFTNISAVMRITRNIEQKKKLEKYNLDQIIRIIDKKIKIKIPPDSVRFEVLINEYCKNKFIPEKFLKNPIMR